LAFFYLNILFETTKAARFSTEALLCHAVPLGQKCGLHRTGLFLTRVPSLCVILGLLSQRSNLFEDGVINHFTQLSGLTLTYMRMEELNNVKRSLLASFA